MHEAGLGCVGPAWLVRTAYTCHHHITVRTQDSCPACTAMTHVTPVPHPPPPPPPPRKWLVTGYLTSLTWTWEPQQRALCRTVIITENESPTIQCPVNYIIYIYQGDCMLIISIKNAQTDLFSSKVTYSSYCTDLSWHDYNQTNNCHGELWSQQHKIKSVT